MKHINITNWQGNITDWTKFNYVYGGLSDELADRVNLRIPGTNLRNYIRKSNNLIALSDIPQADFYGLNYKVENGVISVWGTATNSVNLWLDIGTVLPANTTYYINFFLSGEHESKIGYNIAKRRSDWTNRVYTENPSFTFQRDYTISAICLQFDPNKQYNCTFKPMLVYGDVMPTTYEPYGSMVMVENVGKADLGTLNYQKLNNRILSSNLAAIIKKPTNSTIANVLTVKYTTTSYNNVYNHSSDKIIGVQDNGNLGIYDTEYYDDFNEQTFKVAMSGVYLYYELETPKITVSKQAIFNNSSVKNWTDRPSYNAADRFVMNWNLPRGAGGFTNWNGFNYMVALGEAVPDTFPYICNNNGAQLVVNFSEKGTTTLEQFKEYISNHPLIITYFPPSTSTLSMASPMQLDKTNIEDSMSLDELLEPANEER